MAGYGDLDTKQFDKFVKNVGNEVQAKRLLKTVTNGMNEVANYSITDVKKRTPVDTGNLRRNWQRSPVQYVSNDVQVKLSNNTEYARYVEYGHRKRNHKGWVDGKFFLKSTINDVRSNYYENYWYSKVSGALKGLYND